MADKIDLIVDRIDDLKDDLKKHESREDANFKRIDNHLETYNKQLTEHMRRTDVLEQLHMDNQNRIKILEKPSLAKEYIYKHIIKIGVILGVVATILTVVIKFKEIF